MTTLNQAQTTLTASTPQKLQRGWQYKVLSYAVLTLLGFTMLVPFAWMISTSFKPLPEISGTNFFPVEGTIDNYGTVLFTTKLPRWYLNTAIVAVFSTISVAFFDSLAGFVFAKYEFPGKRGIFIIFLSTLMVPTEMLIIPWFIMASAPIIGGTWVDTYWGIAFPGVITAAGVFLMRQFMYGVPDELLDAARIDGVSEFGLFWRIAVPLSLPAIGALAIFNFLGNWNAFIWPLIVTTSSDMRTLPVGLQFFSSELGDEWHLIMTGATLSVVPLLIVVIIFQRYIIQGIALTGLKG